MLSENLLHGGKDVEDQVRFTRDVEDIESGDSASIVV
jgi:hypothetical protein